MQFELKKIGVFIIIFSIVIEILLLFFSILVVKKYENSNLIYSDYYKYYMYERVINDNIDSNINNLNTNKFINTLIIKNSKKINSLKFILNSNEEINNLQHFVNKKLVMYNDIKCEYQDINCENQFILGKSLEKLFIAIIISIGCSFAVGSMAILSLFIKTNSVCDIFKLIFLSSLSAVLNIFCSALLLIYLINSSYKADKLIEDSIHKDTMIPYISFYLLLTLIVVKISFVLLSIYSVYSYIKEKKKLEAYFKSHFQVSNETISSVQSSFFKSYYS